MEISRIVIGALIAIIAIETFFLLNYMRREIITVGEKPKVEPATKSVLELGESVFGNVTYNLQVINQPTHDLLMEYGLMEGPFPIKMIYLSTGSHVRRGLVASESISLLRFNSSEEAASASEKVAASLNRIDWKVNSSREEEIDGYKITIYTLTYVPPREGLPTLPPTNVGIARINEWLCTFSYASEESLLSYARRTIGTLT